MVAGVFKIPACKACGNVLFCCCRRSPALYILCVQSETLGRIALQTAADEPQNPYRIMLDAF